MNGTTSAAARSKAPPVGFRRAWRALRQLFHEMIGALFGILALIWIQNSFRAWVKDVPRLVVGLALAVAVLLGAFAWTSFRRARQL
jgi:hypothetical protein